MVQLSLIQPRFSTTDISLAAYLHSEGCTLYSIDRKEFPTIFVFVNSDEVSKHVGLFESAKAVSNTVLYYRSYKLMIEKIKGDAKGKRGNR